MTSERVIQAHLDRERARRKTAPKPEDTATPEQKLVRAAETGGFEAIVAAAQPAEPPKMVTPEEREAELHAKGHWPDKGPDKPKATRKAAPKREPREPKRPPTPPPTPGEEYVGEYCQWRARGPGDYRQHVPYGRCLTEYDPLTGEIIGDGYDHSFEEDDKW